MTNTSFTDDFKRYFPKQKPIVKGGETPEKLEVNKPENTEEYLPVIPEITLSHTGQGSDAKLSVHLETQDVLSKLVSSSKKMKLDGRAMSKIQNILEKYTERNKLKFREDVWVNSLSKIDAELRNFEKRLNEESYRLVRRFK